MLVPEAGGKENILDTCSSYRPTVRISGHHGVWTAKLRVKHYFGVPGKSRYGMGDISFIRDDLNDVIEPGTLLTMYEGPRVTAIAQFWPPSHLSKPKNIECLAKDN